MRVLLVNDYGTLSGGAEVMALQLRDGLRRRGHDVRVLASRASLVADLDTAADWTAFGTTTRWQAASSAWNPSARRALGRALRDFDPDVVHVKMFLWQLSPSILPLLKTRRALYHAVTYKAICPKGTKLLPDGTPCGVSPGWACWRGGCLSAPSALAALAQRRGLRRARDAFDVVVVPSETMRSRLEAAGLGPLEVIPHGLPERPRRPPLSGPPLIACASRLSPEKGVATLVRAFAVAARSCSALRLEIAGDGPERAPLEALARREGVADRVAFLGHLSREALERHFDAAWAQAVPSLWEEPFGVVAIEAMMRGTALVASRAGGLRETIEEEIGGLLVPPGDVAAWADAVARLAASADLCERLGDAGRRAALARYRVETHLDRIEALYRRLVDA
jgi:glycosyltransferase involved in cell wall biosynthesis